MVSAGGCRDMPKTIRVGLMLQGGNGWAGGVEYFRNLIKALAPLENTGKISLSYFVHQVEQTLFEDVVPGFRDGVLPFSVNDEKPKHRKNFWHKLSHKLRLGDRVISIESPVQQYAAKVGLDFLYPYFPKRGERILVPTAAWIPDFQHNVMPHFFSKKERTSRDRTYALAARYSSSLVLSSRAAEIDFKNYYGRESIPVEILNFHTVPDDNWFQADSVVAVQELNLPPNFFYCANQFWIHKNHETVIKAVGILKQRGIDVNLVCTGSLNDYRHPGYVTKLQQTIKDLRIADRVFLLGLIPRHQQIQLFRHSKAVIQPSLFEGWSTVVEDCRVLGKRLLLSDIAVHREQDPPNAEFFAPQEVGVLVEMMTRAWKDLPVGPHAYDEAEARELGRRHVRKYAQTFVDIAERTRQLSGV